MVGAKRSTIRSAHRSKVLADGVPHQYSIENCVRVFMLQGYVECDSPDWEDGFEKVAIYADEEDQPTHVARQRSPGAWTSKMGALEDTDHATVHSVEDGLYGKGRRFLRRPIRQPGQAPG